MSKTCKNCAVALPSEEERDVCVRCLLRAGQVHGPAGDAFGLSIAELNQRFPELEILELIGQGGMGAVYRARQMRLDRVVALKVLRPDAVSRAGFTERFVQEAKVLAQLSHPSIIGVYDFGVEADLHWLLLEYVDGSNLREVLDAGTLPPEDCFGLIPHICEALQYAHDQGVVHRDIKPENILLDLHGRVHIADFGLARLIGENAESTRLTRSHETFGTPRYMAPEQITGARDVDHRADIYAVGAVFYELLTGEVPLGRFQPPSKLSEAVDARVDELVLRALAKEPASRYQQAGEVQDAIANLRSEPQGVGEPTESWTQEEKLGLALCIALLALGALSISMTHSPAILMLCLFLPGCGFGATLASSGTRECKPGAGLFLLVASVVIVAGGVIFWGAALPMWSLSGFIAGVGAGHHARNQENAANQELGAP